MFTDFVDVRAVGTRACRRGWNMGEERAVRGGEETVRSHVDEVWLTINLALPQDSGMRWEMSWWPTIIKQILHEALGLETTGDI